MKTSRMYVRKESASACWESVPEKPESDLKKWKNFRRNPYFAAEGGLLKFANVVK